MDPNETLNELRKLVALCIDGNMPDGKPTPLQAVMEMAELVDALDGWLSKGGFLPDAWKFPTRAMRDGDQPNPAHVVYYENRDKR